MTHRRDAAVALARLDSVIKSDPEGQLLFLGNIIATRGWETIGDIPHALAAMARNDDPNAGGLYYSTWLRERGRLAALAGNRELAIKSYRQYLVLRPDADPSLKGQTDRVRAELQRLESQSAR